jgi:hypothetical protein
MLAKEKKIVTLHFELTAEADPFGQYWIHCRRWRGVARNPESWRFYGGVSLREAIYRLRRMERAARSWHAGPTPGSAAGI